MPWTGLTRPAGQAGAARISMQLMVALISSEARRAERAALVRRRYAGTGGWVSAASSSGPPSELADHFAGCMRADGVERFYVWFTDFAAPDTLSAFGREVIAAFR